MSLNEFNGGGKTHSQKTEHLYLTQLYILKHKYSLTNLYKQYKQAKNQRIREKQKSKKTEEELYKCKPSLITNRLQIVFFPLETVGCSQRR